MKVGSKVVCITSLCVRSIDPPGTKVPIKGDIYTVREMVPDTVGMGIRLEEIVNPRHPYIHNMKMVITECGFAVEFFREVDNTFGEEVCSKIEEQQLELQEV